MQILMLGRLLLPQHTYLPKQLKGECMRYLSVTLLTMFLLLGLVPAFAQDEVEIPEDFPQITIDVLDEDRVAPGFIYLANFTRNNVDAEGVNPYLMVLNNAGNPVFAKPAEPTRAFNFGRTPDGNLYYYIFEDNGPGFGAATDGTYFLIDEQGEVLREYGIVNGRTNSHEFLYTEEGHVWMVWHPVRTVDLSRLGGDPQALLVEAVVQEIDPDNNVVFQWHSVDYFGPGITSEKELIAEVPPSVVPYIHVNGITLDLDGNPIISTRRFDALVKVDKETGGIMWVMGTNQLNQFEFVNDPLNGFSGQHHATVLPNGNILMFDNGNRHDPPMSRAVEYEIDTENMTATLVWSYTDGRFTSTLGSVQRLENGNTLIGWGTAAPGTPNVTEVTEDGEVVFSLTLPDSQVSYRAYRFPYGGEES